jgi:hypothetical protein
MLEGGVPSSVASILGWECGNDGAVGQAVWPHLANCAADATLDQPPKKPRAPSGPNARAHVSPRIGSHRLVARQAAGRTAAQVLHTLTGRLIAGSRCLLSEPASSIPVHTIGGGRPSQVVIVANLEKLT